MHAADAGLVDRYAAAKAMEDTELMELYLIDLVPEEEVDGVLFAALDQPGVRLEVALPFGFDKDPKATSEHGGDNRREPATTGRRLRRERRIDRSVVSSARQARHHAP